MSMFWSALSRNGFVPWTSSATPAPMVKASTFNFLAPLSHIPTGRVTGTFPGSVRSPVYVLKV